MKKLYDANGQWVALDDRHRISRVAMGNNAKPWAFHFCDDFISNHATKVEAEAAALRWEMARATRLAG
jgi:hypothetical protein